MMGSTLGLLACLHVGMFLVALTLSRKEGTLEAGWLGSHLTPTLTPDPRPAWPSPSVCAVYMDGCLTLFAGYKKSLNKMNELPRN